MHDEPTNLEGLNFNKLTRIVEDQDNDDLVNTE